ncbi:DNA polymerase III subunit gamma/tau [Alteriqipengyuania flavescens]|uniref:DNA polymerase III subunit gamma/tau n=1 Tax=Alteriqipengyuania flavescens TaxID=3053610 RepID=UPI0025B452D5|nr:DNA polymerase III subunit gamma/tau [Alteriqipengyuania flavescens]WJY18617.1 DNA polymerase III subunit gamma/tau [Alteriqipengyuania flavescens]WJY24557.1 DNA polymerase III subunit gamma/tau [Alteriqipengyuania flavescens]
MGDSPDNPDDLPWATEADEAAEAAPSAAELEAAGQSAMFGDASAEAAPQPVAEKPNAAPAPDAAQPYRVLARKYRPQTFAELIGQDAMVRTLGNAIARDRLAHAFLMTGVRGVGKTSTARLIAKALNCIGPDGNGGPTIDPCGVCEPCVAIAEGRHIDVIEMDAASHTGVDDVREIIEAVRYAAVSARYKIYIVDEVHMLSRNAFNALLKTLEEPPAHVKFIFATTEVDKLPVTVLSRTQRFDLRRIPTPLLKDHFAKICALEGVEAEDEALSMIARGAEGSVRDGLSILDQAISHADMEDGGAVSAGRVRDMLGLADKTAQRRLFAAVLEGDPAALLDGLDEQYALGVEPLALMRSLMDLLNRIAVTQVGKGEADAPTEDERQVLANWAERLSPAQLHRLWQLMLKGHDEVRAAPDPLVAAQMALLRILHAADLPDPGKLAKQIEDMAASGVTLQTGASAEGGGAGAPAALLWPDVIARVEASGNHLAASQMRLQLRIVTLEPGKLVYSREDRFTDPVLPEVRDALYRAYGNRWTVEEVAEGGEPTLVEREETAKEEAAAALLENPMVKAAFAAFPDAEIIKDDTAPDRRRNWSKSA